MIERVVISGIAAGGAGVGRLVDGRALFVHRTAPGEEVDARVTRRKARWARGSLLRILRPSADRRDAPCPFYDRCGGCTLEHITYAAQLRAKAQIVADALQRIGGLGIDPPDIVPSPAEFRYRNRVSFTLERVPGGVRAGFHELERPAAVLDVDERCLLPEPAVAQAWGALRRAWGRDAKRLPSGRTLRLTLRGTVAGRITLLVQGGYGPGQPEELLGRVPALGAVWHQAGPTAPPVLLAGDARLEESWSGEDLAVTGAIFLQVNRGSAALLEAHVVELAGDVDGRTVVDAYCGVGLHARRLNRRGGRVTGIELDPLAVEEARRAVPGAHFIAGRVEDELSSVLPADLVILNPPRSGLAPEAADSLLSAPPDRIIYVSCDPATLARDVARLASRFVVRSIRCFDLFPQTAHVETVLELQCSIS